MEEILADPPVDGGYPVLTRRLARLVTSDGATRVGRVVALDGCGGSRVPAKAVGSGPYVASGLQGSQRIPGTRGALSTGDEAFPPCGRPLTPKSNFLSADFVRPPWYVVAFNTPDRTGVPAKTSGTLSSGDAEATYIRRPLRPQEQ